MKLRCREGDEALIIKGPNSGKVVKVIKGMGHMQPGDKRCVPWQGIDYQFTIVLAVGFFWFCETSGMPLVSVTGKASRVGAVPDHWLLPLRGERDDESLPRAVERPDETAA